MSDYRRWYVAGGTYFFTVVTYRRRPLFHHETARALLHQAIDQVRDKYPFEMIAIVLLPEHLHAVWSLPCGDADFSLRWRRIKEEFTESYLSSGGSELAQSAARRNKGYRGVWHRRFWEHTCRDEADLKRCIDYVHWNPKKHRHVSNVRNWPWSSFHRFVQEGEYSIDWGANDPTPGYDAPEWGE
jgi:putative transposase